MKADCIPFSSIPHTPSLLADYLYRFERVARFYGTDPYDWQALIAAARRREFDPARRAAVVERLEEQNRAWGGDGKVEENLRRLREPGTVAVVTGQQVGLFGGPAYSAYKALTAIELARRFTQEGLAAVPVFWMASEDHDLLEVNHCTVLDDQGGLEVLTDSSRPGRKVPVGEIRLPDSIAVLRDRVARLWPADRRAEAERLLAGYVPGSSFTQAFARLWQELFRGRGLVLVDPLDAGLRALAAPVFRRALEEAEVLDRQLRARNHELRQAGYHVQVRLRENATLLFRFQDGERQPLRRRRDGLFLTSSGTHSREELAGELASAPERFSGNVLLRPVVQDWWLPTAAYVAGPNEITYFAQASVLYQALLGWMPPVFSRASFTLVEPKVGRLLHRYQLNLSDLWAGRARLRQYLVERQLPRDLDRRLKRSEARIEKTLAEVAGAVSKLDPTLAGATETSRRKILYQFGRIRGKAARAHAGRSEIIDRHLGLIENSLYPHGGLQERRISLLSFLAGTGLDLLDPLLSLAASPCRDHQVVFL